jgi:hypothetical protein
MERLVARSGHVNKRALVLAMIFTGLFAALLGASAYGWQPGVMVVVFGLGAMAWLGLSLAGLSRWGR